MSKVTQNLEARVYLLTPSDLYIAERGFRS